MLLLQNKNPGNIVNTKKIVNFWHVLIKIKSKIYTPKFTNVRTLFLKIFYSFFISTFQISTLAWEPRVCGYVISYSVVFVVCGSDGLKKTLWHSFWGHPEFSLGDPIKNHNTVLME